MRESSKTKINYGENFLAEYLKGKILDIGCGKDPILPHADPFDKAQGNANNILDYIEKESYDTVYSSHCLEHVQDPVKCLNDWWSLVKPNGYLIIFVPDEDLYEQGLWPSVFNRDHKSTFRLQKKETWSPKSFDIYELHKSLPNCKIIKAEVQDKKYDYSRKRLVSPDDKGARFLAERLSQLFVNLQKRGALTLAVIEECHAIFSQMGVVVDQTLLNASAQIMVIAQKKE